MTLRLSIIIILLINISLKPKAQSTESKNYPQDYFQSPLDVPLVLAGSFGELRGNHFHSGIDIKTQGTVGKNVFAVADGYVSRINVSPWGYGNALYITHPNGYTSVYGHLLHYNKQIDSLVKATQYRKKSFAIEIFPESNAIKVTKGQIVAQSGNSGGSGGPHLHFEIRRTSTSEPINPLFFGYKIADHQYPTITKLRIYSINNNMENSTEYSLKQSGGNVSLTIPQTILISDSSFYPAVEAIDKWDAAVNKNGIYKLTYYFDGKIFFEFVADKINFSEKRYINSYLDYAEIKTSKKKFQRTKLEPNNRLGNIHNVVNNGIITLKDDSVHQLKIEAEDFEGQISQLVVDVKASLKNRSTQKARGGIPFLWNQKNTYTADGMSFTIPAKSLYSNQLFWVETLKNPYNNYSKIYEIYDIKVPLHSYCNLKIKADSLSTKLRNKACIVSLDMDDRIVYEGGKMEGDYVVTKTRSFGKYFISVDTISPSIRPTNIYNNKNITNQSEIGFKVSDNLSGIDKFQASIDGEWVLLQYDAKSDYLYYHIDSEFEKGKHIFKITVSDDKGNKSTETYSLIRN